MHMLDLGHPNLNWVEIAKGMGVDAGRATTMEQCADLMRQSFSRDGPFLIELMI
jgi:acetolactate synthase-1/2/3 large subunit